MPGTFNPKALQRLKRRTRELRLPELAPLFAGLEEGETPVIVVQQLEGEELALVREAAARNSEVRRLRTAAENAGWSDERLAALQQVVGGTAAEVPDQFARDLVAVRLGTQAPQLDEETTVLLAKHYGVQFQKLAQAIYGLSGQGAVPK